MKLAIFGDSFSSRVPNPNVIGWPIALEQDCSVVNFSCSGSSEFRILKTLKQQDLDQFDQLLICHTSPTRQFVKYNPLHQDSAHHKNCDVIFADIEKGKDNFSVACQMFYKHIFDTEYAIDLHNLICKEIAHLSEKYQTTHITHFDYIGLYQFDNLYNFHKYWRKHPGPVNHYDQTGNDFVYATVKDLLGLQ